MKMIIGLTGEKGSGKGTFVQILSEIVSPKKVVRIASSALLAETLAMWNIPKTRRALQDLAIVMNGHYGDGTLTNAVMKRIHDTEADIVVFDGMRWKKDEVAVRQIPSSVIVYITADVATRYDRTRGRNEKVDESTSTLEKFMEEETVATELDIPAIGSRADVQIVNNGTPEELREQIMDMVNKYIK
jgi:dephospho-CoA kinase